ncbi:MAG: hypothetical protein ACI9PP_000109 [Halobacteriales archaeon]|jgi:hypothetical protein
MGTNTDSIEDGERVEESYAETAQRWMNPRTTTVVLDEREDGTWFATQRGVDVVGQGETAAKAAAEYCRLVDGQN